MILVICLVSTGLVFAKEIITTIKNNIYNLVLEDNGTTKYKCVITPTIIKEVNDKNIVKDNIITKEELSKSLNKYILTHKMLEDKTFTVIKTATKNNNLIYALLRKNEMDTKKIIPDAWDNTTLEMKITFLTKYATEEDISKLIEFEVGNCSQDNFDVVHIDSLNTDVYLYKTSVTAYAYGDDIEFSVMAFFIYEDVLYSINGTIISRDMVIDFINNLE